MGHHVHPYAVQALAFVLAALIPISVIVLLAAARAERRRRPSGRRRARTAAVTARFLAPSAE